MRFKFTGKTIGLDVDYYIRVMADYLEQELRTAAVAWLNATVLSVIPVWSGASAGTFIKLAQSVGFPLAAQGGGARLGMSQSEGRLELRPHDGVFQMVYQSDLWHLVYNEHNDGNANKEQARVFYRLLQPGPYNFQALGAAAFLESIKGVTLPNPYITALVVKPITVR